MKSRAKAHKQITRMGQDGGQPSAAILMVIIVSLALALDLRLEPRKAKKPKFNFRLPKFAVNVP